jgi:hypothetical protein
MARIRTIKPQFWTDEKIGNLPMGARLLFIGLWNLADDEGIVLWNAAYIKGQLFPYDTKLKMTILKQWMIGLSSSKLVTVFDDDTPHDGQEKYGFVTSWHKHQVINRPQPTQHQHILDMINNHNSRNNHGTFTDDSLTEGNKEKEKDICSEKSSELSSLLKELILTNNPKALLKENVLTNWGKTFDLMLSKDKREPQDIEAVIRWTQADDFEKTNVLSADKVRARFDNLYMKMNAKSNNGHSKQQAPASMYQYVTGEALDDDN